MIRDHDTCQGILEQTPWLRTIAREHAGRGLDPDDLVQETLLRALRQPELRRGPLRAWLAGILRNTARETARSEARRRFREQAVASTGAAAGERVPEVDGRWSELQEAVVDLSEPYGSTISLRYLEGLAPR